MYVYNSYYFIDHQFALIFMFNRKFLMIVILKKRWYYNVITFGRLRDLENTSTNFVEKRVMKPWPSVRKIWYAAGETWFYRRYTLRRVSLPWLSTVRRRWPWGISSHRVPRCESLSLKVL